MVFQYNPHIWDYLAPAGMLLLIVIYTAYKGNAHRLWIITQAMVIFWCVGYAVQISATDLKTAAFWYHAANDFVGWKVPVVWLLWTWAVTGKKGWITRFRVLLLFALPIVTDILNLTNSYHGLLYRRMWLDRSGDAPALLFFCGPWYWVITAYCGVLLLAVIAVQAKAALNRELLHRKQGLAIAAATAAVLIFILMSILTQGALFGYYDLTPVAIGIAAVFAGLAFRSQAQEAVPVPRNAVMEKMTNAVLILDDRGRIMDLNPAAEALFGLKAGKAAGRVFEDALPGWPELTMAGRECIGHCEFSRDGRHYEAYLSELNDGRKTAGYIVVIQDVTSHKAMEAQLNQHRQALLVLQERERLVRELHDSLGQILGYTGIQIQAVRDMLKAGRLPAADDSLDCLSQVIGEANTEVREFIFEVRNTLFFKDGFFAALRQYLAHFEKRFKIPVEIQNPAELAEEEFDLPVGVQLFRIIQEALTNVRKHAKAGKAAILFEKRDGQVLISVADDGEGFDPEEIKGGQSFGLEVMKERAGQIGAEISIDAAEGRGTTVTVIIPPLAGARREEGPKDPEAGTGEKEIKIRVLLADDHILFLEGLQTLLETKGFEIVGTARDGLEALEKTRLTCPDMILMDLQMPRCNGLTATRLIKAEMPEVKIVILTMSDREQDLLAALQSGACGYLLKGLRTQELVGQLCDLAQSGTIIPPELAAQVLEELGRREKDTGEEGRFGPVEPARVLSKRQIEILSLIAEEYTYKEVAARLFVSERTVKYQMAEILQILQLQTRRQAIAYARKAGLAKESGD